MLNAALFVMHVLRVMNAGLKAQSRSRCVEDLSRILWSGGQQCRNCHPLQTHGPLCANSTHHCRCLQFQHRLVNVQANHVMLYFLLLNLDLDLNVRFPLPPLLSLFSSCFDRFFTKPPLSTRWPLRSLGPALAPSPALSLPVPSPENSSPPLAFLSPFFLSPLDFRLVPIESEGKQRRLSPVMHNTVWQQLRCDEDEKAVMKARMSTFLCPSIWWHTVQQQDRHTGLTCDACSRHLGRLVWVVALLHQLAHFALDALHRLQNATAHSVNNPPSSSPQSASRAGSNGLVRHMSYVTYD